MCSGTLQNLSAVVQYILCLNMTSTPSGSGDIIPHMHPLVNSINVQVLFTLLATSCRQ